VTVVANTINNRHELRRRGLWYFDVIFFDHPQSRNQATWSARVRLMLLARISHNRASARPPDLS
jgi:hypothetical protein